MSPASMVVIGMGNPMRHDDGIGHVVLERLARLGVADDRVELVALDGEASRLLEAWRDRRRAVVIDAGGTGDRPGAIHRIEVGVDDLPGRASGTSSHAIGLVEALALGRALGRLPEQLIVVAVEPGDLTVGEGLSQPVADVVPEVVARVQAELSD